LGFRNQGPKRIIWIQKINVLQGLCFFLSSITSNIEVRFDENIASKTTNEFLSFFNKLRKIPLFTPAKLLLNKKSNNGYALEYKRLNNISKIIEHINTSVSLKEHQSIRKMTASYILSYLERNITFLTMVENEIIKNSANQHEIFISGNFANNYIMDFFRSINTLIRQSSTIPSYLRQIATLILAILRVLFYQLFSRKIVGNVRKQFMKPSVWIEFESSFGIWGKFKDSLSRIARATEYHIVYYFDRPDTRCNYNNVNNIEKLGFKWINVLYLKHATISIEDIKRIFSVLKKKSKMPLWFFIFYFHYEFIWRAYKNLYKYFNVRILLQHQEWNWIQQAQAQAIESAGGIMIGTHWSHYLDYQYPWQLNPQHVFFVWGKAHYELMKKADRLCKIILPCGLWINGDNEQLMDIRNRLSEKIRFVIAVFDGSVAYDNYQSPDTLSQFYLNIIELFEHNQELGGLIKSKKFNFEIFDKLSDGDQIMRRLEALVNSKRLLLLDAKITSPITAARVSDISVCYGINSAGIIAGLHGCKAIHWDCSGWLRYPIYKESDQKVFYSTLDELNIAINKAASGDKSIGDFSRWRNIINYFDDAKGMYRIVFFIEEFMNAINNNLDRSDALKVSVKKYVEKYGIPEEWFEPMGWWNCDYECS